MPRLSIGLDDWWTSKRRTQLDFRDKALYGCGVSLDVWQHLFDFQDGTWHAEVDGPNVTLVSLEMSPQERAALGMVVLGDDVDREGDDVGREDDVDWEEVSPLLKSLPLRSIPSGLRGGDVTDLQDGLSSGRGRAFLKLHDDCFFVLQGRDPAYLRDALRLIIRVHEHYLGIDLESGQEEELTRRVGEVLEREISIQLESDPASSSLRLWTEVTWFSRVLRRKQPVEELFSFAP